MDHRALLPKITAPTLVIAGTHDPATPPEAGEYIATAQIPERASQVEQLLDAAQYLQLIEQRAEAFTDTVLGFPRHCR